MSFRIVLLNFLKMIKRNKILDRLYEYTFKKSFYFLFLVGYAIQAKQVNLETSASLALSLRNLIEAPFLSLAAF